MRVLPWLTLISFAVLAPPAGAQTVHSGASSTMPAHLGFSRTPATARHRTSGSGVELPHGLVGATIGAIVGGAVGYARVQMYCDGADPCGAKRSIVVGAAIGAALGALVEYAVRHGHAVSAP
jgi:hypothetical protein